MDAIIKSLADLLLVGGTVGGYAMITIILLIVGYFKYLKPFLIDFAKITKTIDNFIGSNERLTQMVADIEERIDEIELIARDEHKQLSKDINDQDREHHNELMNLLKAMEKEINVVHRRQDTITNKTDLNNREVMVEVAKLQTRLEFMNTNVGARGIQK